jgi:hypothetical protein
MLIIVVDQSNVIDAFAEVVHHPLPQREVLTFEYANQSNVVPSIGYLLVVCRSSRFANRGGLCIRTTN